MKKKDKRRLLILVLILMIGIVSILIDSCSSRNGQSTGTTEEYPTVTMQPDRPVPDPSDEQTDPTEITDPVETTEKVTEPEPTQPITTDAPGPVETALYYLTVNCQTNTVNVYTKDANGNYTVPYRVMVCSSGLDQSPTPTGVYQLTGNRWEWLELVGGVWGMYTTQIVGDYLFHSVPYTAWGDHGSLQEGEFDKLGEDASHGCIRLQVEDAKWIYHNMWDIEAVEIYNSPNPGPLGKPEPPKIGGSAYPRWDPTDPDGDNPWHRNPALN